MKKGTTPSMVRMTRETATRTRQLLAKASDSLSDLSEELTEICGDTPEARRLQIDAQDASAMADEIRYLEYRLALAEKSLRQALEMKEALA